MNNTAHWHTLERQMNGEDGQMEGALSEFLLSSPGETEAEQVAGSTTGRPVDKHRTRDEVKKELQFTYSNSDRSCGCSEHSLGKRRFSESLKSRDKWSPLQ